jgi:AcrR family transcriptional regulator
MPDCPRLPLALPLLGKRPERGDAAANRKRILAAADALFAERGVAGTSMDAIADAAGVGKGTLFRRFGDRAGLIDALLDDAMAEFQDAFLSGPPPLGPGAPASVRLEAFVDELLALTDAQLDFALAAARATAAGAQVSVHASLALFVRAMVAEIDTTLDGDVVAELLLGAVSAGVVYHLRRDRAIELERIQAGARALLHGLIAAADSQPGQAHTKAQTGSPPAAPRIAGEALAEPSS